MTEAHRTPDAMSTENELICEKLLGWKRTDSRSPAIYVTDIEDVGRVAPSFTTWAEAGLILHALRLKGQTFFALNSREAGWYFDLPDGATQGYFHSGPLAIRAAALEYIRSQS